MKTDLWTISEQD